MKFLLAAFVGLFLFRRRLGRFLSKRNLEHAFWGTLLLTGGLILCASASTRHDYVFLAAGMLVASGGVGLALRRRWCIPTALAGLGLAAAYAPVAFFLQPRTWTDVAITLLAELALALAIVQVWSLHRLLPSRR